MVYYFFLLLMSYCAYAVDVPEQQTEQPATIQVAKKHELQKMKLVVIMSSEQIPAWAQHVVDRIGTLLSHAPFTLSGFAITHKRAPEPQHKKDVISYADEFPFALFLNVAGTNAIAWRLYDTQQAAMIKGGRVAFDGKPMVVADAIADDVWQTLTGQEQIHATRLAACKEDVQNKKTYKNLYLLEPLGHERQRLSSKTRTMIPRWNRDLNDPLLFYSQSTASNVCLMALTPQGNKRVVSNHEGLNMQPSCSADGSKVIYCMSGAQGSQLCMYTYDETLHRGKVRAITNNNGNNLCPTLCDNGDIVFLSDYRSSLPQIYYYHADSGETESVSKKGVYSACPVVCPATSTIVYIQQVGAYMQLFSYNIMSKKTTQLTFDASNKQECSCSPGGQYIAYMVEQSGSSRIAVLNTVTGEQAFITPVHEHWGYPAWSPRYSCVLDFVSV